MSVLLIYRGRRQGADETDPEYDSGEIGAVQNETVVVVFSERIESPGDNFAAGVTIQVGGVNATISSATLQSGDRTVHYVLSAAPLPDDEVTWAYAAASGDLQDRAGNALGDVAATAAVNTVGRRWRFNHAANSMHHAML